MLKIWSNGFDYVVAKSERDAIAELRNLGIQDDYDEWRALQEDEELTLIQEVSEPPYICSCTKVARKWCEEHGHGFLATLVH